jgi:hypothetical protein
MQAVLPVMQSSVYHLLSCVPRSMNMGNNPRHMELKHNLVTFTHVQMWQQPRRHV